MSEFSIPVRVYYEDTDAGGVVYYANYLKYFERARTEYLRNLGFEQDELRDSDGVLFAVHSVQVNYHFPARFNEELDISARITKKNKASMDFEQMITRKNDNRKICSAKVKVACLDAREFLPCPIPVSVLEKINDH